MGSTWGNYSNYNTANNYTEGTAGYEKNAGSKQNTGSSENWKANNIYDLAGNCTEWTQEADLIYNCCRADRGGIYYVSGSYYPAFGRSNAYGPDRNRENDFLRFSSHFNNKVEGEYKFKCVKSKEIGYAHFFVCRKEVKRGL